MSSPLVPQSPVSTSSSSENSFKNLRSKFTSFPPMTGLPMTGLPPSKSYIPPTGTSPPPSLPTSRSSIPSSPPTPASSTTAPASPPSKFQLVPGLSIATLNKIQLKKTQGAGEGNNERGKETESGPRKLSLSPSTVASSPAPLSIPTPTNRISASFPPLTPTDTSQKGKPLSADVSSTGGDIKEGVKVTEKKLDPVLDKKPPSILVTPPPGRGGSFSYLPSPFSSSGSPSPSMPSPASLSSRTNHPFPSRSVATTPTPSTPPTPSTSPTPSQPTNRVPLFGMSSKEHTETLKPNPVSELGPRTPTGYNETSNPDKKDEKKTLGKESGENGSKMSHNSAPPGMSSRIRNLSSAFNILPPNPAPAPNAVSTPHRRSPSLISPLQPNKILLPGFPKTEPPVKEEEKVESQTEDLKIANPESLQGAKFSEDAPQSTSSDLKTIQPEKEGEISTTETIVPTSTFAVQAQDQIQNDPVQIIIIPSPAGELEKIESDVASEASLEEKIDDGDAISELDLTDDKKLEDFVLNVAKIDPKYVNTLMDHKVSYQRLLEATDEDLKSWGITALGPRLKILKETQYIKQYIKQWGDTPTPTPEPMRTPSPQPLASTHGISSQHRRLSSSFVSPPFSEDTQRRRSSIPESSSLPILPSSSLTEKKADEGEAEPKESENEKKWKQFLSTAKVEFKFLQNFIDHNVSYEKLLEIEEKDLLSWGFTTLGPRMKILNAIALLKPQHVQPPKTDPPRSPSPSPLPSILATGPSSPLPVAATPIKERSPSPQPEKEVRSPLPLPKQTGTPLRVPALLTPQATTPLSDKKVSPSSLVSTPRNDSKGPLKGPWDRLVASDKQCTLQSSGQRALLALDAAFYLQKGVAATKRIADSIMDSSGAYPAEISAGVADLLRVKRYSAFVKRSESQIKDMNEVAPKLLADGKRCPMQSVILSKEHTCILVHLSYTNEKQYEFALFDPEARPKSGLTGAHFLFFKTDVKMLHHLQEEFGLHEAGSAYNAVYLSLRSNSPQSQIDSAEIRRELSQIIADSSTAKPEEKKVPKRVFTPLQTTSQAPQEGKQHNPINVMPNSFLQKLEEEIKRVRSKGPAQPISEPASVESQSEEKAPVPQPTSDPQPRKDAPTAVVTARLKAQAFEQRQKEAAEIKKPALPPGGRPSVSGGAIRAMGQQLFAGRLPFGMAPPDFRKVRTDGGGEEHFNPEVKAAVPDHKNFLHEDDEFEMFDRPPVEPEPLPPSSPRPTFNCVCCAEDLSMDEQSSPIACGHLTCRSCMREHILAQMKSQNYFYIFCPACYGSEKTLLEQGDLVEYLEPKEYEMYLMKCMEHPDLLKKFTRCFHPGCPGVVEIEADYAGSYFPCPVCQREWCRTCSKPRHSGACSVVPRADEVLVLPKGRRCPNCQIPVIKEEGCNHITCVCKKDWCYLCGEILDPKHLGAHYNDTDHVLFTEEDVIYASKD